MSNFNALSLKGALLLGSLLAVGTPAFAVPVTGILGFSGTSLFTFTMSPGNSFIDFREPIAGGTGVIDSDNRTGFFLAVGMNEFGTIRDLSTMPNPPYAFAPPGGPFAMPIDDFLFFPSIGLTTNIRLRQLPLCTTGTCVGPFQLSQIGDDVSVALNIVGDILNNRTAANPDISQFSGTITAQFLGTTVGAVIAAAGSPGGVNADSYSGAILARAAPIPEPGTVTMLSIGALAMFLGRMRSKRRSNS